MGVGSTKEADNKDKWKKFMFYIFYGRRLGLTFVDISIKLISIKLIL